MPSAPMSPPSSHSADLETEAQPGSARGYLTMPRADLELEASPNHRSESCRPRPATQSSCCQAPGTCVNMPATPGRVQELGESPGTILPGPLQPCQWLGGRLGRIHFLCSTNGETESLDEYLGPSRLANQDELCYWGSRQVSGLGAGCLGRVWH